MAGQGYQRIKRCLVASARDFFCRSVTMLLGIWILSIIGWCFAFANELSPVGLWKTIDDNTGKPRGLVRITEVNGEYHGKVERGFPKPGEEPNPRCEKCDGTR